MIEKNLVTLHLQSCITVNGYNHRKNIYFKRYQKFVGFFSLFFYRNVGETCSSTSMRSLDIRRDSSRGRVNRVYIYHRCFCWKRARKTGTQMAAIVRTRCIDVL